MIKINLVVKKIQDAEYGFNIDYLEQKKEFIEGLLKAVGEMKEGLEKDKEVDTGKTISDLINKDKENEEKNDDGDDDNGGDDTNGGDGGNGGDNANGGDGGNKNGGDKNGGGDKKDESCKQNSRRLESMVDEYVDK